MYDLSLLYSSITHPLLNNHCPCFQFEAQKYFSTFDVYRFFDFRDMLKLFSFNIISYFFLGRLYKPLIAELVMCNPNLKSTHQKGLVFHIT